MSLPALTALNVDDKFEQFKTPKGALKNQIEAKNIGIFYT